MTIGAGRRLGAAMRVDEHVNFAWDKPNFWPTGARQQSSARWTGAFLPPTSGEYRFAAFGAHGLDEYRLYVDGKLVLDRARRTSRSASPPCSSSRKAGRHPRSSTCTAITTHAWGWASGAPTPSSIRR